MAITYSISGGADAAKFNIDGSTGVVRYTTEATGPFDAPGTWALQVLITFTADQQWSSTFAYVDVAQTLDT